MSNTNLILRADLRFPRFNGLHLTNFLGIATVIVGLVNFAGFILAPRQFLWSHWVALLFGLSLALGVWFCVMLHHLRGASWSVVIRRISENLARAIPWIGILFIPVMFFLPYLFGWSNIKAQADDALWQAKLPYLNIPFFITRALAYFLVWSGLGWWMVSRSIQQDQSGSTVPLQQMRRWSAPGMVLLGFTVTFAAFDWIMSLDFHWYSTIFGIYFASGAMVASLAAVTLLALLLRATGHLTNIVTTEHLHDLGKLIFSFSILWAYMAFSQYFLIWYGNIPEETEWYIHRLHGGWKTLAVAVVIGQFIAPFFFLMSRSAKRSHVVLAVISLGILVAHYLDLYWQVMPEFHGDYIPWHWTNFTTILFVLVGFSFLLVLSFRRHPMIPIRDPQLEASIQFHND